MYIFYMYECVCTVYMPDSHRGQNRALESLELESQVVMSHLFGA